MAHHGAIDRKVVAGGDGDDPAVEHALYGALVALDGLRLAVDGDVDRLGVGPGGVAGEAAGSYRHDDAERDKDVADVEAAPVRIALGPVAVGAV